MKTNFSRFGRSAVSVVLSAIMLLSTVIVNAETINVDSVSEAAASDTVTVDITPDDVTQTVMDVEDVRANSEDDSAAAESVKKDEEESQPDAAEVKTEDVKADTAVQANSKKSEVKKTPEASGAESTTIYFFNLYGFSKPSIHAWKNGSSIEYTKWDGSNTIRTATDNLADNMLARVDLGTTTPDRVVFHQSSSNDGSGTINFSNYGKVFVPYTNELAKTQSGGEQNIYDSNGYGYWVSYDDFNTSVNSSKTVYFDASALSWSTAYIYCFGAKSQAAIDEQMTPLGDSVYSYSVPAGYTKVIFKKNSTWGEANDQTVDLPLVGHDSKLMFEVKDAYANETNSTAGKRVGSWTTVNSYPSDEDLEGCTSSLVSNYNIHYHATADALNGVLSGSAKPIYQVTDNNGITWYYAEFSYDDVKTGNTFFVLDNNGAAVKVDSSIKVKTSNSNMISYEKKENSQNYFGRLSLKYQGDMDYLRIYVNGLDSSSFSTYTIVPHETTISTGSVRIIAKDGTIRKTYNDNGSEKANFNKYSEFADTMIYSVDDVLQDTSTHKIGNSITVNTTNYDSKTEIADIPIGSKVVIKTTINSGNDLKPEVLRKKYYVKAFNINGETVFPDTPGQNDSGVYTCTYTIPSTIANRSKIEITPIYFYNESYGNRKYITFIVDDFKDKVEEQWGKKVDGTDGKAILSCYAWYGENQDTNDPLAKDKPALGGYPGQPMVYENGHYIMQVPTTNDADTPAHIQGITLNNYVWDFVHCDLQGASNDSQRESVNCQTYDYDDFVVLSHITPTPEFIAFRFKYRTTKNPYTGTATTKRDYGNEPSNETTTLNYNNYVAETGNGWDYPYTDYYNNTIDLFNNILNTTQTNNSHFYVVSDGYQELYYGHFTTLWYVYDDNKKYVGKIPSSAFYYLDDKFMDGTEVSRDKVPDWFMQYATQSNTTVDFSTQKKEYWRTYYDLYKGTSTTNSALGHPVEVTYETAIRAEDVNIKDKHPRDPALRNDGNWHYSRSDVTFGATIKIQYSTVENPTVFGNTDSFVTTNDDEEALDKPYAGSATGAHAYFTNKTYTPYGEPTAITADFYQDYTATGVKTSRDSFTFEADQSSTGTNGTIYVFKGWYLENSDGTETLLTTTKKVNSKMASTADMRSETKLIAKYAPLGDALVITHDLYKNADKYTKSPAVLNGTGTPKVSVQVYDSANEQAIDIPYVEISDNQLAIDKDTLAKYIDSGYQLKVTLDVDHDNDNKYETTYLKTLAEDAPAGTDDKGYYYPYTQEDVTGPAGAGIWNAAKTAGTENNDQVVYTTAISDLLTTSGGTTSLKTNNIKFYTQLSTTTINVVFKYYDRKVSNSTPLDIDTTATQITKTVSVSGTPTLADAVGNAAAALIDKSNTKIDNDIDEYKFWGSLSQASEGIAEMTRPNGEKSYSQSIYHTDYYARQFGSDDYFGGEKTHEDYNAKWVTYLDANGVEIKDGAKGETQTDEAYALANETYAQNNTNLVSKVVVWGYNAPKTYKMTFNTENVEYDTNANLYLAKNAKGEFTGMSFYYNERVGQLKDPNSSTELVDQVSKHLAAYGISQKSDDATKVYAEAQANVNVQGTTETKYFDGWYEKINGKYVKVSSDPVYGNRVTKGTTLYAGYNNDTDPNDENATVNKGITVTANDVEKYVVGDTDYIRYTTVLNSYGFDDSDPNFKSASVVYVRLGEGVKDYPENVSEILKYNVEGAEDGRTLKEDIIAQLNKADEDNGRTAIAVTITSLDPNAKTVIYSYDVIPTYTDTNNVELNNGQIQFTNKNRTQFSMNLPVSAVETGGSCKNLVVFAAVKYEDSTVYQTKEAIPYNYFDLDQQSTTTTDPDTGESVTTTTTRYYIASDNYIIYKDGAAVNN